MDNLRTPFTQVYDSFLSKVTDDMYVELNELDTFRMLEDLLIAAIAKFEFPRKNLYDFEKDYVDDVTIYCGIESDYDEVSAIIHGGGHFNTPLTFEEINILATYMIVEWLTQQVAHIDNVRMKYSGSDFKFTSQANHMAKLKDLKRDFERDGFHLQRLYKRRTLSESGAVRSTFGSIMNFEDGGSYGY